MPRTPYRCSACGKPRTPGGHSKKDGQCRACFLKNEPRPCMGCGKVFTPARKHMRFCSPKCGAIAFAPRSSKVKGNWATYKPPVADVKSERERRLPTRSWWAESTPEQFYGVAQQEFEARMKGNGYGKEISVIE